MKKIRNAMLVLGLSLLGLNCEDDFVNILPYGKLIPTDTDDLARFLNREPVVHVLVRLTKIDDLLLSENFLISGLRYFKSYSWGDYMYNELESDKDWDNNYKIISYANFVLQHIGNYPQGSRFNVENTKGRALFLRAYSYFYLINGYAKTYHAAAAGTDLGVPLPLKMDIHAQLPRSTVQQGYDLIINDLKKAIPLLDDTPKYNSWPGKASAYALLGLVYLYQKEYAKSAENAKHALELYHTLTDYNTIAYADPKSKNPAAGISNYVSNPNSNKEILFFNKVAFFQGPSLCTKSLINVFDKDKDLRFRYFIADKDDKGVSLKGLYQSVNKSNYNRSNLSTPGVYLNYCEALMRQSSPQMEEALIWLNKLRKNRYDAKTYEPYESSDPLEVLKEVMLERRRELRFTAWRWFDMKRLGVECTRTVKGKTYTLKATSNNYVWAIPLNVMAKNPLLKQNPRGL